jgi:hypothetical protein
MFVCGVQRERVPPFLSYVCLVLELLGQTVTPV